MHKLLAPLVGAFLFCTPASAGWLDPYDPNAPIVQPETETVVKPPRHNQQHIAPTPPKRVAPRPAVKHVVKPVAPVAAPAPVVIPIEVEKPVVAPKATLIKPAPVSWWEAGLTTIGGGVIIAIALALIGLVVTNFVRGFQAARKGKA